MKRAAGAIRRTVRVPVEPERAFRLFTEGMGTWWPHSMPEPPTEVEVSFAAEGGGTRVELEHRGWDALSDGFRESLHEIYVRGWPTTLDLFAAAAAAAA